MICRSCGTEIRREVPASVVKVGLRVMLAVCQEYGIYPTDLLGRSRQRHFVNARSVLARELTARGLGPVSIGRLMNRDHSTVINLLRRPV